MKKLLISSFIFLIPFSVFSQDINLGSITTYIDTPVVEQRQIFSREDIDEKNVDDLPSLLASAGIQMLTYGPYGLEQKPSIRGFTDETVRVVIDGVCVNNPQYGTFDFSSINIDDIERVEVVRGGFTEGVSDEGAVGGVIYITTKSQNLGHHFYSDTSIKSYFNYFYPVDTFSESLGYSGQLGNNSFLKASGKGTFANNKYLYNDFLGYVSQRNHATVIDGSGTLSFQHYYGNGNSITAGDSFYGGNKETPGSDSSKSYGTLKDYDNNLSVQSVIPTLAGKPVKLKNTVNWISNTRFYNDAASDSKHYVNTFKYCGTVDYYGLSYLKESAGFTFDYTHLDSTDDGIHDQFSGTFKSTTKFTYKRFSVSLPLAIKFCNKNVAFTPKIGFGLKTDYIDIFLDGYRMTQFPNMDDLYWEGAGFHGNPNLIPETGWGGDFTVNVHNIFIPFSVCAFTNYYENKIKWAGNTPKNVASAFYFGIDFNFEQSFFNNRFFIKGTGEYLYTKLLDKSSMDYGKKIMWTPDFVGSFSTGVNIPVGKDGNKFKLIFEGNYVGKRYESNLNIYYLKPYFLVNISSEYTFIYKNITFTPYGRLDNLTNADYKGVTDYPMPGITGTLGLKIKK